MKETKALTSVPDGIVHVPVTPFTENNEIDLDIFGKVIEFLVSQDPGSLCVNLHLAENLNLTLEERKQLAKASVDVTSGRTPVIIHVSTPGTDQAVDLTRHAEEIGADCIWLSHHTTGSRRKKEFTSISQPSCPPVNYLLSHIILRFLWME